MSRLRKAKIFSYILPIVTAGFLISIVGSVCGYNYTNRYIGKIDCQLNQSGNSTEPTETMTLYLSHYKDLSGFNDTVRIYTGGENGLPIGLIATAQSAQAQRTLVDVYTDGDKINRIVQKENPDDIAGDIATMRGDDNVTLKSIQDVSGETYYNVVELRSDLDAANLTTGLNIRFTNQDRALRRIIRDLEGGGNTTK